MEGMTGKAIISSGLPLCLDFKETNTKFHHRLKCYLNILENVVFLSEIRPALPQQPVTHYRVTVGSATHSRSLPTSAPASSVLLLHGPGVQCKQLYDVCLQSRTQYKGLMNHSMLTFLEF